jgi:transcriptional regulator with XRE-family HTH domain
MPERVKAALSAAGLSGNAVEREANLSSGEVSRIINGSRKKEPVLALEKIAAVTGVRLEWIRFGTGQMRDETASDSTTVEFDPAETSTTRDTMDAQPEDAEADVVVAPKMKYLTNFKHLDSAARQLEPSLPEWVHRRLHEANPLLSGPVSVSAYVGLLQWIFRYTAPPDDEPMIRRKRR